MPWRAGRTPVTMVVCDGNVTLGTDPITPAANAPARASESSTGSRTPSDSARARSPGQSPSTEMRTTREEACRGEQVTVESRSATSAAVRCVMAEWLIVVCSWLAANGQLPTAIKLLDGGSHHRCPLRGLYPVRRCPCGRDGLVARPDGARVAVLAPGAPPPGLFGSRAQARLG